MITKVSCYQTKDGKLHDSFGDASAHIVRELENIIGPVIEEANKELNPNHYIGPTASLMLVGKLVGTPDRAKALRNALVELLG